MRVDQCEVWVTSEGQRLPEYQLAPAVTVGGNEKTLACFIPSQPGKGFAVEWRNTSLGCLGIMVKLDGDSLKECSTWCQPGKEGALRSIRTSSTTKHAVQFSELVTTDADGVPHMPANEDLGTIWVEVYQVQLTRNRDIHPSSCNHLFPPVRPVHERSKKAGTHCVTLGEAIEKQYTPGKWTIKAIESDGRTVAKFLFRYRSLAHLQAQGVAPIPVQPPEPSERSQPGGDGQGDGIQPIKRRRVRSPGANSDEEFDVKPAMGGLPDDDEDKLAMLKGQLSEIMERITRMQQKKKRRRDVPRRAVKEEYTASGSSSQLGKASRGVIDLTLSD